MRSLLRRVASVQLSTLHFQLFWAPGDESYALHNDTYHFWTSNGGNGNTVNPPTASLPLVDIPGLTAKSQILPALGRRLETDPYMNSGWEGYCWSCSPNSSAHGDFIRIDSANIYPIRLDNIGYGTYGQGHSIRCVRP